MTNNGLERSNGQNYSCGKRLSIPNHMTKICQFLKEQKDMKAQDKKFVSKKQMENAERFLNTNSEFYRYKKLKGKKNYRTVVKKDFGLICGHVLEIILFPQQSTNLSEDEFTKEATSVFKRRTDLEWNDFDQFKNDSKNFAFVEVVYQTGDEKGDFFCACSCKDGIKGKACNHIISAYFLKNLLSADLLSQKEG